MVSTEEMARTFNALGDKTRFKLYRLLVEESEICVSQLAKNLTISPACVSQHMKILMNAGLIERVRNGQRVCYKVVHQKPYSHQLYQLIFEEGL